MNPTVRQVVGFLSWKRPLMPVRGKCTRKMLRAHDLVVLHGAAGDHDIFKRNADGVYVPISAVPT